VSSPLWCEAVTPVIVTDTVTSATRVPSGSVARRSGPSVTAA
jgi:hypothetical protein